jgi:hypothetical protein
MRRRTLLAIAVVIPALLASQSPAAHAPSDGIMLSFERFGDLFGGRLVAALDSIPAARYDYRPTPEQQTIGHIAQHLENGNYELCETFGDLKHPRTAKDSLADTVKARWPKDTLVARVDASLRFCDSAIERAGPLRGGLMITNLLNYETDLAEHYSQLATYMRLLGMVPPSALPPSKHVAVELPASALASYVGAYQLTPLAELVVTLQNGALFVKSNPDGAMVRLYAERDNVFFVKEVEAQLTFTRDAHGAVNALVFHQFGLDRAAPKIR